MNKKERVKIPLEDFFKNPEKKWCLAALLHDAPEYVIGDMISPVKSAIGSGYQSLENRLSSAINLRFGLPTKIPDKIKKQIKKAKKMARSGEIQDAKTLLLLFSLD